MSPDPDEQPSEVDDIEARIAVTRQDLAETVDALSAKADVKARASAKAEELTSRAQENPVVPAVVAAAVVVLVVLVVRRRRQR